MHPVMQQPALLAALLIAALAAFTDLKARIVPNVLVGVGLVLGIGLQTHAGGLDGLLRALMGAGIGLAIFLPFYLTNGMGAGDVKLMAALGSCLGPMDVLRTALVASFAGALLALAMAARRGVLRRCLRGTGRLLASWFTQGPRRVPELTLESSGAVTIPYAVPIAAGAFACVLGIS